MAEHSPYGGSRASTRKSTPTTITNAKTGTSRELASREKRYAITMAIRTACFVAMIFVSGPMRWVFLAGAVILPYVAVLFANQVNSKTRAAAAVEQGEPSPAAQLTVGPPPPEIIHGELGPDQHDHREPSRHSRSGSPNAPSPGDDRWVSHDRVA